MVVASAALMDGIIDTRSTVDCVGSFTRYSDIVMRCWNTYGHGNLNVSQAITHSCNYFFYEMGYRFGLSGDPESGTNFELANTRMREYADAYGLTDKSGVEIEESMPQFSMANPSASAIGQGEHNYTTVGLARYVATVANSGTCYNLSLLDKVTDRSGNLLEDFTPEVRNTIEMPTAYWDAIHSGMKGVVEGKNTLWMQAYPRPVKPVRLMKTSCGRLMHFSWDMHHMKTRKLPLQPGSATDMLPTMPRRYPVKCCSIILILIKRKIY